jgi:hypothetical protein
LYIAVLGYVERRVTPLPCVNLLPERCSSLDTELHRTVTVLTSDR